MTDALATRIMEPEEVLVMESNTIPPGAVALVPTNEVSVYNLARAIRHLEHEAERQSGMLEKFIIAFNAQQNATTAKAQALRALLLDYVQRHGPMDLPTVRVSTARGRERVQVKDEATLRYLLVTEFKGMGLVEVPDNIVLTEVKGLINSAPSKFENIATIKRGEDTLRITWRD